MARYLIVGGVAGGATAAARIRRLDEKAEIILFEKGEFISFANCGLPYYLGGVIKERDRLFVTTSQSFSKRYNIDVRTGNEVVSIDRAGKTVTVRDTQRNTSYKEKYDKLLLSPGAEPIRPDIPGIRSEGIFTLRNIPDTDAIKSYIDLHHPAHAVVVGGGFIGLEMAENLSHRGIKVTLVEALDQVMAPADYEIAAEVHHHLRSKGISLRLKDKVLAFSKKADVLRLDLSSGSSIDCSLVILSIGIRPESGLAKDAGLTCNERGAIIVDDMLRTSDPSIYAVGDAISSRHLVTKESTSIYLAGPANRQARIAADNIVHGDRKPYKGSSGTAIAKVFDLTVATAGLAEKTCRSKNIECSSVIVHASSHAGYYPDPKPITVKLIFDMKGTVLGGQAVGYEGVDSRIDMISAVINAGGSVYDLGDLDHAYAPPYSSAKDPVHAAAFAAQNIIDGLCRSTTWDRFNTIKDHLVVDVRTKNEFALGSITGSLNIPLDELRENLGRIPKDRALILVCAQGLRGYLAYRILTQNGFPDLWNLSGGYKTYERATEKFEPSSDEEYVGTDDMIYKKGVAPEAMQSPDAIIIDACGLQCPGPIIKLKESIDSMIEGRELLVTASDPGFARDVKSWCSLTGNKLVSLREDGGKVTAIIRKSSAVKKTEKTASEGQTIIVFSDDLDKALASFVLATGGAAAGKKVTMFFTFWGLSVIKKPKPGKAKKDLMGKMFGMMLPSKSKDLSLSKMNMGGIGRIMMRFRMKSKKIDSLESMIESAHKMGVEMIACQMSMDVMGVVREELFDYVRVGGVAAYLESASESGINLFI
jgi:NADPH-dependent 2,4-dienoyl-CoA reductase/sulfur reductase-like enzyme/peroxiredoxin family protein/TusA-related sulfurtransferase/rhodanese-related sulfurtransferase